MVNIRYFFKNVIWIWYFLNLFGFSVYIVDIEMYEYGVSNFTSDNKICSRLSEVLLNSSSAFVPLEPMALHMNWIYHERRKVDLSIHLIIFFHLYFLNVFLIKYKTIWSDVILEVFKYLYSFVRGLNSLGIFWNKA